MSPVSVTNRHSQQGPPPKGWTCVSCGQAVATALELGCPHCGAGTPGKHVGVPQPPPPRSSLREAPDASSGDSGGGLGGEQAYLAYAKGRQFDSVEAGLAYEAFMAGYQAALAAVVHVPPLPGTAESRTIIAALRRFAEEVLPLASEEIASGEYLSIEAVDALIAKLERTQ